jgi:ABC-type transporter Mla subunit MlaD
MDDVSLTQLFARMDAHLERQDDHLARQDAELKTILETLNRPNAVLADRSQLLATTAREVAAIHAEASRGFAGAMHLLSNLVNRLEGRS